MRNRTYGGVRGRKTKVGRKLLRFPPTRLYMIVGVTFGQSGRSRHWLPKREGTHGSGEDRRSPALPERHPPKNVI